MGQLFTNMSPAFPYVIASAGSNICDSATGKFLFMSNGMRIWDTSGNIMVNGDSLQPLKIYTQNTPALQGQTQGSLILPKGSNGEFYVFIPTVSDSLYNALWVPDIKTPFDELRYNVVNMNLNGGLGAVTIKNKTLLKNTEMVRTKMQACRHANGYDWWLLKQTGYGPNNITRFLITKDSIYGPFIQNFAFPNWGQFDALGQIAFSKDGKKFASVQGKSNKLFMADFDRCTGELNNPIVINIPIDSTTYYVYDNINSFDSLSSGVCFSQNGQFVYISKPWNIYQLEYQILDSSIAWSRIQHGPDTTFLKFEYYGHLYKGPDERIYIGKGGGTYDQFSVIDYPNNKGLTCGFCRKCFRIPDSSFTATTSPPNMPDYTLGADLSKVCWPLESSEIVDERLESLEVYPNPCSTNIEVRYDIRDIRKATIEMYNAMGQQVYSSQLSLHSSHISFDVRRLPKGMYYIRCLPGGQPGENKGKKVIVE
ncbi:MAG: T9SS type A sorting domain-containing protein [Bacteroidetes bacterium]|nr:T9SS type A sorting domain-containing protein [Bacteroidota bacterium]